MTSRTRTTSLHGAIAVLLSLAATSLAAAHSASDAYLTLTWDRSGTTKQTVIGGQWDIALRDLDFVLKLDDNGDGQLNWREVRDHHDAIEAYAYRFLRFDAGRGNRCTIKRDHQLIDDHADGAYAALFFTAECAHMPKKVMLRYSLFFAIDPSHRGIFVLHDSDAISTALLSPENANVELAY